MRNRKLGGNVGAAKLVGDHRLAALGCTQGESAKVVGMMQRFEEEHVAGDIRIIQRAFADLAEAQIGFAADRDETGEADPLGATA
ncbi:hypothetical protein D9M71_404210 [compost metagenome]